MLPNSRHELYAQGRAGGATIDEAYVSAGYKPNRGNAARLNANEGVRLRILELQKAGADKAEITIAGVLSELWRIATADPGELIEWRVGCCRYCWGKRHRHQETPNQRAERAAQWERDRLAAAGGELEADFQDFDERGGLGFDATRAPNPGCPECFGQGEGQAVLKDTRRLSPAARALYAGVKVTKDGHQVLLHDKVGSLTKVGQHLGMFVERRINTDVSLEEFLAGLDADGDGEPSPPEA